MASTDSVKILEVCQVAPAHDLTDSPTELSLPLTFLDTLLLILPPAGRIYFYKFSGLTPTLFHSEILPTLKQSLSRTLLSFLLLAGQLTWPSDSPKPIIYYAPNDTVSVTIAESNADFDSLVGDEIHQVSQSRGFVPELFLSETLASIMSLQITLFPDKGFSIAIIIHHAALDGVSISMFLKAWASMAKHMKNGESFSLLPEQTPFLDRTVMNEFESLFYKECLDVTALDSESIPRSLKLISNDRLQVPTDLVRATFRLSRENIEKLREKALHHYQREISGLKVDQELRFSTFVLAYAYVAVCLVKTRGGDSNRKVGISVAVDCRNRLDPPIPKNYFGNCIFGYEIVLEAGEFMQENGAAVVAKKINDFLKGLRNGIFQDAKESLARLREIAPDVQQLSLVGSPRFMYYEEDFGWGPPEKVDVASINWVNICGISDVNGISLIDSKYGNGGVEIGLSLLRDDMEAFASLFAHGLEVNS
ncbi:phenolic glucoside malonyltransferase 1 [Ricinus communis]|uniref:Anthocyanin 5-aromatic acyltransferase, putative n=1 Tax=Ricinus communis TaxID=3988 RepID=B9SNQ9_RICCO|nr:phenolic glucoside malonyltransferase 1 [Ricinus communis]EEF34767.1 Anthocyanin 5-aromatic acyltransferase, putative [Ricinus communis]|eukprot:XP_025014632.1 phenolic glucoside malonyltransferase 1 [Ricinus communis]